MILAKNDVCLEYSKDYIKEGEKEKICLISI